MSASPGKSLLLRVNTTGSTFVTAGGLRSKQVKRAAAKVDVTSADSAGRWQELLPGAAPQSLTFSASDFVWLNDTAYQAFRTAFEGGTLVTCQIVYPGAGYYQGAFVITQLDESAPYDKEISSSLTLESAGQPAWTTGAPV
ncbi:phage major tail protein, TP901-1 family [Lichenifustis flavocetrariae]|uniref:Phage major tail protein, TP901-1 family n=1 Tax=Lichenifustis flavocetrariae TaxID=2949735 RepID=A0AA42CQ11_9HYPH|nr:phage major tail protein, TP901-1 family [Lichenifustis flavocetrariae]MCW6510985.1 phage major tail protein, TP901-1 family [Lichenifustis flavocetrariae]